jgi:hypothetical protein
MAKVGSVGAVGFHFTTMTAVFLSCKSVVFTLVRRALALGNRWVATSTERDICAVPSHNQRQGHR